MTLTATIGTTVDEVLALVDELDEITLAGMDLRTHALTACGLAIEAGADPGLVAATLLHGIGRARYLAKAAPGVPNEEVGRRFVQPRFGDRPAWLVQQATTARRYLATIDKEYAGSLPTAARSSARKGGPLTDRQLATFEAHPLAGDVVALRRWADKALWGTATPASARTIAPHLERAWAA